MKKLLICFSAVLLLFACNSTPKGVLSEKTMTDVLYDMYLADACNTVKGNVANIDSAKRQSYRYILHKYNVSVADFDSSMVWYAVHPQTQSDVYDKVNLRLQALLKDVNAGKYKQIIPVLTENDTVDVWPMSRRFDLTAGTLRNKVLFHFDSNQFKKGNALLLTYKLKLNKTDQASGNRLKIKVTYSGKTDSLVSYARKDGIWRHYRVYMPISNKLTLNSIDGSLLECSGNDKHQSAIIDDIRSYRIAYANAKKHNQSDKSWWQKLFSK
ncbi:MAG: hypothetical protein H6Q17_1313 [Bacteroidetes bacterium]|nr:hypothetical protein [Bacteroidota bacterium]